jgi:hypothetical protein
MTEIILALIAGIGLGGFLVCRRVSKRTGQTMMQVLRGHPGEERQQVQGGEGPKKPDRGDPGEER